MKTQNTMDITCVDTDEVLLAKIFKHPFGIIIVYLQALLGLTLALGLAFFLLPSVFEDTDRALTLATVFSFIAVVFAVAITTLATIIYRQSHIMITDKNITQVLQSGLFRRKVSQLTMENVEDVTSVQTGIFASIFNFGVLKIETAGEQENFHFNFCPRPNYYAKLVLEAREKFNEKDGN